MASCDGDKNKLREYHHDVATKLVEYSRQGKVQSTDTMGERSKEVLVQSLAGAILGRKYGFMQAEGPEDRMSSSVIMVWHDDDNKIHLDITFRGFGVDFFVVSA